MVAVEAGVEADPIDAIVAKEMAAQRIPGVAVAIVRSGDVIKAQGYGLANVEHNVPVTPETIFQSGSLGKQITAAGVMLLVDDGKLALSDPLSKFYPDGPASWRSITIHHLLTHTSGLPDYNGGRVDLRRDYTEDELARLAYEMPLDFAPGEQWQYSNTGYLLLGALVRKVSGNFYGDLLRDRVFQSDGDDDGAGDQRGGHRAAPGRRLPTCRRRAAEPGMGGTAVEYHGRRLTVSIAAGLDRLGSRGAHRSGSEA